MCAKPVEVIPRQNQILSSGPAFFLILGLIALLAAAVRLVASEGDLWLDEIWSLILSESVSSPIELFTKIRHDNNHILNSLFLYLLGSQKHLIIYRLPAVIAGILTVVGAVFAARPWGRLEIISAAALTGFSFLMVQYSSEARGYAFAAMFSVFAFISMRNFLSGRRFAAVWFSLATVLGFLSHLSFVQVYAALTIWAFVVFLRKSRDPIEFAKNVFICNAAPLFFLFFLYWFQIRYMVIGGGPAEPLLNLVVKILSLSAGAPERGWLSIIGFLAVAGAFAFAIFILARLASDLWVFFASILIASPAIMMLISPTGYLYVRYFLVCVLFVLLLMSFLAGWLYRSGKAGRIVLLAAACAFATGNAVQIRRLMYFGRGHYQEAMRFILDAAGKKEITIGSDHDFHNGLILEFYSRRLNNDQRLVYVESGSYPPEGTDWVILHGLTPEFSPPPKIADRNGHRYQLNKAYPFQGLSGWSWFLYRRE